MEHIEDYDWTFDHLWKEIYDEEICKFVRKDDYECEHAELLYNEMKNSGIDFKIERNYILLERISKNYKNFSKYGKFDMFYDMFIDEYKRAIEHTKNNLKILMAENIKNIKPTIH